MEFLPSTYELAKARQAKIVCTFTSDVIVNAETAARTLTYDAEVRYVYDIARAEILKQFATDTCLNKDGKLLSVGNVIMEIDMSKPIQRFTYDTQQRIVLLSKALALLNDEFAKLEKGYKVSRGRENCFQVSIASITDVPGVSIEKASQSQKI